MHIIFYVFFLENKSAKRQNVIFFVFFFLCVCARYVLCQANYGLEQGCNCVTVIRSWLELTKWTFYVTSEDFFPDNLAEDGKEGFWYTP